MVSNVSCLQASLVGSTGTAVVVVAGSVGSVGSVGSAVGGLGLGGVGTGPVPLPEKIYSFMRDIAAKLGTLTL